MDEFWKQRKSDSLLFVSGFFRKIDKNRQKIMVLGIVSYLFLKKSLENFRIKEFDVFFAFEKC
jgi:hypothetical protein